MDLSRPSGYRLSPQQRRLWRLGCEGTPAYRSRLLLRTDSETSAERLERALESVVRRYEVLRTGFRCPPGTSMPLQFIETGRIRRAGEVDLRPLGEAAWPAAMTAVLLWDLRGPFDLETGICVETLRVRIAGGAALFAVSIPSLCADRKSLDLLLRELRRECAGTSPAAVGSGEPLQFADLAEWQNQLLESEETEGGRDFWRRLGGLDHEGLSLPFEARSSAAAPFRPERWSVTISEGLAIRAEALASSLGAPLEAILLAVWQIHLGRLAQRVDVRVGMLFDDRKYDEVAGVIGPLSKFLPVAGSLADTASFVQLAIAVAGDLSELAAWREFYDPEQGSVAGADGGPAWLPYCFEFYRFDDAEPVIAPFALCDLSSCCGRFRLDLVCVHGKGELALELWYDPASLSAVDVSTMARQLRSLLEGALEHPEAEIGRLPLLSEAERLILRGWSSAPGDGTAGQHCVHHLFERQVAARRHAVALCDEDHALTYGELDCRANRLGRHLRRLGARPGRVVGIYLDRSAEMLVAILGAMKAGAAYLALEPGLPRERLAWMLVDAGATWIVTSQALAADLVSLRDGTVICLDEPAAPWTGEEPAPPEIDLSPRAPLYVLFTSGSTGRPKGVLIEHHQLAGYVLGVVERFGLSTVTHFATVSTFAADLGNTSVFGALCSGGCLHVVARRRLSDAEAFAEYSTSRGIECLKIVPSHLAALLSGANPAGVLPSRKLVLGGEALDWDLVEKVQRLAPACEVYNHYGPTETTVGVTTYRVPEPGAVRRSAHVPIGKPLGGARVHLLDPRLEPVPIGVPGELFVGGPCVARGYLGRPDLTAIAFVPDASSQQPGARSYRTGDLARWLPSGVIEFLGRRDHQIKIRGFRVELGEVEMVLREHPAVREAVVLARPDNRGSVQLAACLVLEPPLGPKLLREIQQFAGERLPDYMRPGLCLLVEQLPLTPNGKLDQAALARLIEQHEGPTATSFAPPRTPVEQVLADLWREVLRVERVGVHDNFFALGGHSLLATRLVSRLRRTFRVELPLQALFDAPTIAEMALRIESQLQASDLDAAPPLSPVAREGDLPLSFAQERLWFLHQLDPGGSVYNITVTLCLRGHLDREALAAAITGIVCRHEALRTVFPAAAGRPRQAILGPSEVALPCVDLSGLPGKSAERQALQKARELGEGGFDLAEGPLLRTVLLALAPDTQWLSCVMHHIVSDRWSLDVLVRELAELYRAHREQRPPSLPPLTVQYVDFAVWQRRCLEGEGLERQLRYWRDQLCSIPSELRLPSDRSRPAVPSHRGGWIRFDLGADVVESLGRNARSEASTLFMVLLAAWAAQLYRWTGETDIAIGAPVAARNRSEIEGLIGFFINTLVLRIRMDEEESFPSLLRRVRQTSLDAFAHQDVPFEKLVEDLQPERRLGQTPLFQTLFLFQNTAARPLELPDLAIELVEVEPDAAKFDLTLAVEETSSGLVGVLGYSADLFDGVTVQRMAEHVRCLLAGIAADPGARTGALPWLSDAERQAVLRDWSDGGYRKRQACYLDDLFAQGMEGRQDAVAVVEGDRQVTYDELTRRSDWIAMRLTVLGTRAEEVVVVSLERSLEQVTSILGVLKAGCAYLPLDPGIPSERLRYVIMDTGRPWVLTLASQRQKIEAAGGRTLAVDEEDAASAPPAPPIERLGSADSLAYVIYTSGSTGRPKGVMVPHRGIVNRLLWMNDRFPLAEEDGLLQKTSASFDASIWEIFLPLYSGARLVLAEPRREADAPYLLDTVRREGITVLQLVPSMLGVLLEEDLAGCGLRRLFCGGEALGWEAVERLTGRCAVEVVNLYGPTEASIDATYAECTGPDGGKGIVSLGRPLANVRVYVLSSDLRPLGIGNVGELAIGGAGLARGYCGRADLTAASFVPDPVSDTAGARLYRTGDLARWRRDARLEYLGRRDGQVKVRGFRIELGEIEAVLAEHPRVSEAAALIREGRLIVFAAGDARERELREFARERLPDFMVPWKVVAVDRLPRLASGKIDRGALAAAVTVDAGRDGAPPRGWLEELVASVWKEVLGVEEIGKESNFFELGGHSLLATQVASRLRKAMGFQLELRWLFEAPTVEQLSRRLEAALEQDRGLATPPLVRRERRGDLPLSFAQERLWFLQQLDPEGVTYNATFGIRLTGSLGLAALEGALHELVCRHEVLRTLVTLRDGRLIQVVQEQPPRFRVRVDLRDIAPDAAEAELPRLAAQVGKRPFDLARGPLLRAALIQLGEDEHAVLLALHHIVCDGWSIGVLAREIGLLYADLSAGRPSSLAPLPVQYADYAAWQRGWLTGEALEKRLEYWRARLAGAPPHLDLPADRPRLHRTRSGRGGKVAFSLDEERSRNLRAFARRHDATVFMLLLAAFQSLLARHSGRNDVVVGVPVAGRDALETEDLIGFLVNMLALRAEWEGDPLFAHFLGGVRGRVLEAYTYQDLPFERLVEDLQPERMLDQAPLCEVVLQLQNMPAAELGLPDVEVRRLELAAETAKFDFVLTLSEHEGEIGGVLIYSADLFDRTTALRLAEHYHCLLEGILTGGTPPLSALPWMSAAERHQVLWEWPGTGSAAEPVAALHRLFEAQAATRPDAVALTFEEEALTYGELDARADDLARFLGATEIGPHGLVGLYLEPSPEMLIALLGVLKAGAAYLPIDPNYPRERTALLIADAPVCVLLTCSTLAAQLPEQDLEIVELDRRRQEILRAPGERLENGGDPDQLCYVIYTSGSTGVPKGVMVSHRSVVRLFTATRGWFSCDSSDVWTLFHSYAFDFSVWEIWGALLYGGRLVIVPRNTARQPQLFHGLLVREEVTVLNQTPSGFYPLCRIDAAAPEWNGCLRWVIFGGEALDVTQLEPWLARHGDQRPRLANMYGITETTVHVTYCPIERRDLASAHRSVVGVAIPDLRVYLLDSQLEPVPAGVTAEVYVAGAGLAWGYWNRAGLTGERFIPDPCSGAFGSRLYRTGDIGRYLPNGEIEYLGRSDQQVKIRGFRIELGEIETCLRQHPKVADAALLARGDQGRERRLVAYVVPKGPEAPVFPELRGFLAERLPEHMLPSAVVVLDAFPMTASGKLDRRRLPEPGSARPDSETPFVAPRTPLERYLAGLYAEALGLESVGVEDDFFKLGGNSISGALLINRLQRELGEIVHVVAIFDAPTVVAMARYLEEQHPEGLARRFGAAPHPSPVSHLTGRTVDTEQVEAFRALLPPLSTALEIPAEPCPPAVFVLSPPRSGSTLLRVMLGGHPRLFAPPELEMLSFATLEERDRAFQGRNRFWTEGLVRAVMEAQGVDADEAEAVIDRHRRAGATTAQLYSSLQSWLHGRILVDKTPSYALDPGILARAEKLFDRPLYIHLSRHPGGMIVSFEEAKLDQIFFRREYPFSRRELAELVWIVSHDNILRFLATLPEERRLHLHYEDLVRRPRAEMERVCAFLGLEFHPDMIRPYASGPHRMADGIRIVSRMLGDVKFHEHRAIDAAAAERWRNALPAESLGPMTRRLAADLGYGDAEWRIPPLPRRPGFLFPLSFAQERLWFFHQLQPESPAYNIFSAFRLTGSLEALALERTLTEIVRRHETLRTTFVTQNGRPLQLVRDATPVPLPCVDLAGLPPGIRQEEVLRLAARESRRPFDLELDRLLRVTLIRLGPEENAVLMTMHHIVSDGWSMGVLLHEATALYRRFSGLEAEPLPELPVQYADFAVWQRRYLSVQGLAGHLAYWTRQLAAAPPLLDLPTDRVRPAVQTWSGSHRFRVLEPGLSAALRRLAERRGETLFMVLLALFQSLLYRITGQEDVLVGSPVAGRNRREIEGLIGFFANTLVLRGRFHRELDVAALLAATRHTVQEAFRHQDLPFERLVEELSPQRNLSYTPVFQVLFALQNAGRRQVWRSDLMVEALDVEGGTAKFDLTLAIVDGDDGLGCVLEYNRDLFDGATAERIFGGFERLAAGIEDERSRVSEISLASDAERHQMLWEWQGPWRRAAGRESSLTSLFAARARTAPDAAAVVGEGHHLSYGELGGRAGDLARRLWGAGVSPGGFVGLSVGRSVEMVIGILGILEAGGAYVPLDASYPRDRLEFMRKDARARVLVRDRESEPWWGEDGVAVSVIARSEGSPAQDHDARPDVDGRMPAYVIYTSGSTGVPKGVVVTHDNVVRLFRTVEEEFGFGPREVWTLFHSYAFDFSVWEIWGALLYGGRLVVVPYAVSRSPEAMWKLLYEEGVTVLSQTPSSFTQLIRAEPAGTMESGDSPLRRIVFGGEALEEAGLAAWWGRHAAGPLLINMYGITETTVHVTYHRVLPDRRRGRGSSVGRPLSDLQLYILDTAGALAPTGVTGEIHVGGAGLAMGYLGRPDLTAERFVPNGFGDGAGERLYRTGDLGRHLASGAVEYLGRIDHQVKVRGFRIELGEIEAALRSHGAVAEAVVAMRQVRDGRQLVGYVVPTGTDRPSPDQLRRHLAERLPKHMIPAAFVSLEGLPLTANGKVDRARLPKPDEGRPELEQDYVAPSTPVAETLAGIWAEVLGLGRVGVRDNFFVLGGDSILALQVVALARERGLAITIQDLFRAQTISELAEWIETSDEVPDGAPGTSPLSLISEADRARLPEDVEDAYPLTMLQAGMIFQMQLDPRDPPFHNVGSWQLRGRFEAEPFREALRRLVARHPVLRTSFHLIGFSEPLQLVHRKAETPATIEDLRHLTRSGQEEYLDAFIRREKRRLFAPEELPQIRFFIHLLNEEEFRFTLTENHAVWDGWSLHSALTDLFRSYFALCKGEPVAEEPPLRWTFRDFVALEREALASEACRRYWEEKLDGFSRQELPRLGLWGDMSRGRLLHLATPLAADTLDGLGHLARSSAVPLKSVLLAAHLKALGRLSGSIDVLTGLVSNGRPEVVGGERVAGLFLNTLPFRLFLEPGTWGDLLQSTFHAERELLPFRRYPMAMVRRTRGGDPLLFDTSFNFTNFHVVERLFEDGDLEVLEMKKAEGTDLPLSVTFSLSAQLLLQLAYDGRIFTAAEVRAIGDLYERVFQLMIGEPQARHDMASLLTGAERQQVLVEWSDTEERGADAEVLHHLFASRAGAVPDRVALYCGDACVSYGELDRRAARWARFLRASGFGREARIGICAEPSLEMVIGMLAILKAGAAYVALDPTLPGERLAFLLEDSAAACVLVTDETGKLLPDTAARHLRLDVLPPEDDLAVALRQWPIDPDNAAYVLYTSGSTGTPKGVVGLHRGAVNRLRWMWGRYPFTPGEVGCIKTSIGFVDSVWEIFGALLGGVSAVVVPRPAILDRDVFVDVLASHGVTRLVLVPSLLRVLLEDDGLGERMPALRVCVTSGEALPADLAQRFGKVVPGAVLLNLFGSTEVAADITWWEVPKPLPEGESVSIGSPIANGRVCVLDRSGQPAGVGVTGRLYAAGSGLARGYLGRPDWTAAAFTPHPFPLEPGERLYATGDLALYRPDGRLEFLGRADQQLKIRGMRVELAEIEASLRLHAAVNETAVTTTTAAAGDRQLVAYWVAAREMQEEVRTEDLRRFLMTRLPDYMVPSVFLRLESFPLTASGKIDRRLLPVPDWGLIRQRPYTEPGTEIERGISAIWQEVLGLERVGVEESFFEAGGHSLSAMRVISRIREAFGVDFQLRQLFETPTISGLASELERQRGDRRRKAADLDEVLAHLGSLSDEEVRQLLAQKESLS